jgi:signal peptidase I
MKQKLIFDSLALDILGQGCYLKFCAHGSSMSPSIRNGDIITVEPKKASELNLGDIVFYRRTGGQHVAHRLTKKSWNNGSLVLTTKGDNMDYLDTPVFPEQVLGRIIRVEDQSKGLCTGGRASLIRNRLLPHTSYRSNYAQGMLERSLAKLRWLIGGRTRQNAGKTLLTKKPGHIRSTDIIKTG